MEAAGNEMPGHAETLAECIGVSVEPSVTFEDACAITKWLKGGDKLLPKYVFSETKVGPCTILEMPLSHLDLQQGGTVMHLVDIVRNVDTNYQWDDIKGNLAQFKLGSLPETLPLKRHRVGE
jgi:hypothetical protein